FPDAIDNTLYSFNGSYVSEDMLVTGNGFWLRFENSGSVNITGENILDQAVNLHEGWNLVSGISQSVYLNNISDPDELIIPGTLYDYGEIGYMESWILEPGKGYWLRTYEPGVITLTSGALAKTANQDFSLNANSISINGSDLYFGVGLSQRERLSYSLPPKPPAGAFDVRFKDGWRVVKDYGEVEVMPTTETLTISYDISLNAGEHHNWVLSSETLDDYVLEDAGELTVPSAERFILERKAVVPATFTLHQNFPNPFNPITTLRYDLPSDALVTLSIYDMLGREITQLVNTIQDAGFKSVQWDATDSNGRPVSAGVYLYQIQAGEFVQTKKMVLLK
ncbi:MAG TPA: T9SS type A sorting domain-containing protein, partial [Candidatus Marinimicrobia bacterium]|nr:T9SS type A sorting domain-containing protein [Candidatus Neomarinimicrobiota bacterium]